MRRIGFALLAGLLISGVCSADGKPAAATAQDSDEKEIQLSALEAQQKRESEAYETSVYDTLKSSTNPRDWALAGALFRSTDSQSAPSKRQIAERLGLLKRAQQTSPNDAVIQWLVLGCGCADSDNVSVDALKALEKLEPDNGAVWNDALTRAAHAKDRDGVDAALRSMATASRFDNHVSDISTLLVDAYARVRVPDSLIASMPEDLPKSEKLVQFYMALGMKFSYSLPALQFLLNACRTDQNGRNAARKEDCTVIGRMMAANSDTALGTMIGFAVLRVSRTFTPEDVKAARNADWIMAQQAKLAGRSGPFRSESALAFENDWNKTGSEIGAMREELVRENIPTSPPADWIQKQPRFSDERLKQDDSYLVDHTIDY